MTITESRPTELSAALDPGYDHILSLIHI